MATSLAGGVLPAQAEPSSPPNSSVPSKGDVEAAQQRAQVKRDAVAAIQQRLADASAELDQLQIKAALAGEKYLGALAKLAEAKAASAKAQRQAQVAQAAETAARKDVGELARQQIQGNGPLLELTSILSSDGPQDLIDRAATFTGISASLQGRYQRLDQAEKVAAATRQAATDAQKLVQQTTDDATEAKKSADAAAKAQQDAVDSYQARRTQLLTELAKAEQISLAVARQRQEGLEAIARAKAAAAAKAAQEAQIRREQQQRAREAAAAEAARVERDRRAAEQAAAAKKAREAAAAKKAREAAAKRQTEKAHQDRSSDSATKDKPKKDEPKKHKPKPKPRPDPVAAGSSGSYDSSAAQIAIEFARKQIGEPYVFGATGPSTWDCSGLTMRAWEAAGVNIGHYTGIQWDRVQHISESQLRPGDLIFWANNANDPSTIFHVALYIGGGQMIQAPRPGRDVEIQNVYYWIHPNFFGRP